MQFPFTQWAPDAGETAQGALMVATGVQPVGEGYGPARSLQTPIDAEALPDAPRGVLSGILNDATNTVYAFTATDAYALQTDYSWLNIGSGFTLTGETDWSLARFGNKLLATNTSDGLQQYDVEVPAGFSTIADAGDPKQIFVCANTVVALDCLDNAGNRDTRLVRTSAIGDQTEWKKRGADYQPLEDGGPLVGGVDLKNGAGLIFQTEAMRVIQFGAGGAKQFSLTKVSDGRGAVSANSMVSLDGVVYWLSTDGFKSFSGGAINHIGSGRVDRWFLDRVSLFDLPKVGAGIDPANKLVVWRYPSLMDTSATVYDNLIGYSWQYDKWFAWVEQTSYLARISTPGYTMETMDAFGVLDGIEVPLDDRFWQGRQPVFAGLDENYKFATFSGSNYAATLQSNVGNAPFSSLIGWATPIDDAAGGTLQLGVKDQLSSTIVWKDGRTKVGGGKTPQRGRGFNIAWQRNIPASDNWTYAKGVDFIVPAQGGRR